MQTKRLSYSHRLKRSDKPNLIPEEFSIKENRKGYKGGKITNLIAILSNKHPIPVPKIQKQLDEEQLNFKYSKETERDIQKLKSRYYIIKEKIMNRHCSSLPKKFERKENEMTKGTNRIENEAPINHNKLFNFPEENSNESNKKQNSNKNEQGIFQETRFDRLNKFYYKRSFEYNKNHKKIKMNLTSYI